jgi:hypothetical protein
MNLFVVISNKYPRSHKKDRNNSKGYNHIEDKTRHNDYLNQDTKVIE